MYKSVFQSSKMALLFAGVTLVSAVSMVGTPDDNGLVTEAVDRLETGRAAVASDAQAFADANSQGDASPAPPSVFGDFNGAGDPSAPVASAKPAQGGGPMNAPLSATATVTDSGSLAQTGVPFISEREMTISPE